MFGRSKSNSCCNHSQPNPNYHRYWVYNLAPSPAKPTIFKWLKSMQDHYKLPLTEVALIAACTRGIPSWICLVLQAAKRVAVSSILQKRPRFTKCHSFMLIFKLIEAIRRLDLQLRKRSRKRYATQVPNIVPNVYLYYANVNLSLPLLGFI